VIAEEQGVDTEPEVMTVIDDDGETVYLYRWRPASSPIAAVQILHGMGEHARRYDHVAQALTDAGFVAYADDHRASGRTGAEGRGLGDLGPRGMAGALDAVYAVSRRIRHEEPGLPLFLMGHSWGSFLAQRFVDRWGTELAGLLLSGSTLLVLEYANLGDMNEPFAPARTPYDWLSRDPLEVDRYVADPWCGLEVAFAFEELIHLMGAPADTVPSTLPVLVLNGSMDAVGGWNGGGRALADAYRDLGLEDVTYSEYADGRHELFNETNKHEVIADVVGWLGKRST
jgi:alpha-beta hydrolase superfamily lysophospholipase